MLAGAYTRSMRSPVETDDEDEDDEDEAQIVNVRFKYTRAQERNVIKYLVMRLWQQCFSKTRDGDLEKCFIREPNEDTYAFPPEWTTMNYDEATRLWGEVVVE